MKSLKYLLRNHYSQTDLAKLMGYRSRSTVSMWVSKKIVPAKAKAWMDKEVERLTGL